MIKTMTAQALVPHFGYCDEIVFDEVIKLRNAVKSSAAASGINFSYLPVVIKAVSLSLLRFPQLNAKMTQDMGSLEHFSSHNIGAYPFFFLPYTFFSYFPHSRVAGVAMATPTGLVVPNVKNVQVLSLLQIASELTRLTGLARGGAVPPADLTGGTFSLSNIGAIGGTYASPVVLPGELAIGALGRLRVLPR
jgi:2-oxoisovalerate dehydrogenase E2 component (dihydrolipoyl transacylase)